MSATDPASPISTELQELLCEEAFLARRLPLEGTFNVRDIGGYPAADGAVVAWGRLLRGDALHLVDDEGRKTFGDLGLRLSLDLREPGERLSAPDRLHPEVQRVAIPFFSFCPPGAVVEAYPPIDHRLVSSLEETYRLLVHERGAVLVGALRELLRPGALPAIVHCTLGKDRTGVLIALVLGALGVPDAVIAADYAATQLFLTEEFRLGAKVRNDASGGTPSRLAAILRCEPELMADLLEEINARYGGVLGYLAQQGFGDDEVVALRVALLLERPALAE